MAKKTSRAGRKPTGPKGERVSDYHQLTVRVPPDTVRQLNAAVGELKMKTSSGWPARPRWRIVAEAVAAYVGSGPPLSDEERQRVQARIRRDKRNGVV